MEIMLDPIASHLKRVAQFYEQEALTLAHALNDSQRQLSATQRTIENLVNEAEKAAENGDTE